MTAWMQAWSECHGHGEQPACWQSGLNGSVTAEMQPHIADSAGEHDCNPHRRQSPHVCCTATAGANAGHLKRNAYLYVRQSTLRQVFENTESNYAAYGLRQNAVALGWPVERIIVIDSDPGQSGASAVDREGFQKLVTEVESGQSHIVLGLEVSRLARNSTDLAPAAGTLRSCRHAHSR